DEVMSLFDLFLVLFSLSHLIDLHFILSSSYSFTRIWASVSSNKHLLCKKVNKNEAKTNSTSHQVLVSRLQIKNNHNHNKREKKKKKRTSQYYRLHLFYFKREGKWQQGKWVN